MNLDERKRREERRKNSAEILASLSVGLLIGLVFVAIMFSLLEVLV